MPFDFNAPKKNNSGSAQEDSPWTVPGSSASSPRANRGFQNPPHMKRADPYAPDYAKTHSYSPNTQPQPYRRPKAYRNVEIPWRYILPVLGVILLVVVLYIFRNEITSFLSMLLSWVIVLVIVVAILKSFLGIGRR